jgi:protein-arginine kinase activator protein McsA
MKEETFKAFTLQLLILMQEEKANSQIFTYWSSPNNPERVKMESKIEELKEKLKQVLIKEKYSNDSIIRAVLQEQNNKFEYHTDNMGV